MGYQFATQLSLKVPSSSSRSKRPITKEEEPKGDHPTRKKSRNASSRKPGKDDTSSKAFNLPRSEGSAVGDRPNRSGKPSRTLQQSPPVIGNLNRPSPLMSNEVSIPQTVPQITVAEQAHRQRATQSLYNSQNISFAVEPMQPHHQPQQQQQQQHHQAEFLRRPSNPSQSAMQLSSRTVQSIPLMNPTIVQTTPPHIPQYFHHPQQAQTQQQPPVATAQQVRQQQLLQQQQQQRQIAQMQRAMQPPSQSLAQPFPFSGQSTYGQPPTFPHVSHVASTTQMVMPQMQSQPMNNTFGLQHPPQEQSSQGQQRSRNAEEDYDPLFMLFNQ